MKFTVNPTLAYIDGLKERIRRHSVKANDQAIRPEITEVELGQLSYIRIDNISEEWFSTDALEAYLHHERYLVTITDRDGMLSLKIFVIKAELTRAIKYAKDNLKYGIDAIELSDKNTVLFYGGFGDGVQLLGQAKVISHTTIIECEIKTNDSVMDESDKLIIYETFARSLV